MLGGVGGCWGWNGYISCQIRLRLSGKVDVCEPLHGGKLPAELHFGGGDAVGPGHLR